MIHVAVHTCRIFRARTGRRCTSLRPAFPHAPPNGLGFPTPGLQQRFIDRVCGREKRTMNQGGRMGTHVRRAVDELSYRHVPPESNKRPVSQAASVSRSRCRSPDFKSRLHPIMLDSVLLTALRYCTAYLCPPSPSRCGHHSVARRVDATADASAARYPAVAST